MEIILFLAVWGVTSAAAGFVLGRLLRAPALEVDDVTGDSGQAALSLLPLPDDPPPNQHEDVCMVKHNPDA